MVVCRARPKLQQRLQIYFLGSSSCVQLHPPLPLITNKSHCICPSSSLSFFALSDSHQNHSPTCPFQTTTKVLSIHPPPDVQQLTLPAPILTVVRAAEQLIYNYPTRFHDVEDAKAYIASTCNARGFQYGIGAGAPSHVYAENKSRVCYVVAVRAFNAHEFWLDTPLVDRQELRGTYMPLSGNPLPQA